MPPAVRVKYSTYSNSGWYFLGWVDVQVSAADGSRTFIPLVTQQCSQKRFSWTRRENRNILVALSSIIGC